MTDEGLLPAPTWVTLAGKVISAMPLGRYRAIQLLPRPRRPFLGRMPLELGGFTIHCDLRDKSAREVCFTGRFEPQETALLRALLRPGMTFVDVGANWGFFTLAAAHLVGGSGRVAALEPDPRLFPILHGNVVRNGLAHVTALPFAAADKAGTRQLAGYDEAGDNFGLSSVVSRPAGATTFAVAARPLDAILEELRLESVDVLKMDIEGAEGLALAGLSNGLKKRKVKRLLLELHPSQLAEDGQSAAGVIKCLADEGYRAWTIDHSPSASRRAHYRRVDISRFLRPLDPAGLLDDWPHLLWALPDLAPL